MKKLLIALCFTCALAIAVQADDTKPAKKKTPQTAEQKALTKEMVAKHDANKDGKLSKEEKATFSAEEKAKWQKVFPSQKKKNATTKEAEKK